MDSPLLKYSAKDYFFKAALCHFCIDMLNAKVARPMPTRPPRRARSCYPPRWTCSSLTSGPCQAAFG